MNGISCNFCNKSRKEVKKVLAGPDLGDETVYICDECIELGYNAIHTPVEAEKTLSDLPTPEEIKAYLDIYVIEQHLAKETLAVAIYNHYKRINNPIVSDTELKKSNVLLVGPSGTGKTLLVSTAAKMMKLPFVQADATNLTEAGYVGEDVENMLERLIQAADGDIELAQKGIIYIDEIDKKSRKSESSTVNRDVSGEGVQQALLKLVEGTKVMIPHHGEFDTKNILFIAGGAFVGLAEIIKEGRKDHSTIGFSARLDKSKTAMLLSEATSEDLMKFGLIPEFIGRFPVLVATHELNEDMLIEVLTKPKNCLVDQYRGLFSLDGVDLEFDSNFIRDVAKQSLKQKTGARGLQTILEKVLLNVQFQLPRLHKDGVERVVIGEGGSPFYYYEKKKVNDE
jgi:ATP-dependent Clp protease ATP-binding subunit ClpX